MTESHQDPPKSSRRELSLIIGFWILLGLVTAASLFLASRRGQVDEEIVLRNYRMVDRFEFTDQNGDALTRSDLEGKIWITNFIFTSCTAECIVLSHRMGELQKRYQEREDVVFISISVDPQTDTPERLTQYARKYGAGPKWSFLTGGTREVDDLIKGSFLLPIARNDRERSKIVLSNLIHSERIAVVDQLGVVRFYADGMAPNAVETLTRAVDLLLSGG